LANFRQCDQPMTDVSNQISLNFLEITPKTFDVYFSRTPEDSIVFGQSSELAEEVSSSKSDLSLTKNYLLHLLEEAVVHAGLETMPSQSPMQKRISFPIRTWTEGVESVWMEPYYLAKSDSFGFLIDFKFRASAEYRARIGASVDRRILQLSGSLDAKGLSNKAFYQFKFGKIASFIEGKFQDIRTLRGKGTDLTVSNQLIQLPTDSLDAKTYQFAEGRESSSPFFGLQRNPPYEQPAKETGFLFLFKETDRNLAVNLLKGLRGEWSPNTFSGLEKMFRIPFDNERIRGKKVSQITPEILNEVVEEILQDRENGSETLPVIITRSKTSETDDELYYRIKYAFISNDIACQVVTKDLIVNPNALKYSLSNIALQMFAKAGGKPWIVKPAISKCLIVGIGSRNKERYVVDDNGQSQKVIEKFLAYSILTDSSGLFKEIQVLSESDNEAEYYSHLIAKLGAIITNASTEGYKDIVIHSPFRISKAKVWDEVFKQIPNGLKITVLVINNDHKFFGFDLTKNALVPYESSLIQISGHEYLVWFEGLQYNNSVFTKRIGGPIYVNFWYANDPSLLSNQQYRRRLLQDCINLSGANWRGFKAKQLPVSIYYCQKIAEFLKRFDDYGFEEIQLQNLKPWFL